MKSLISVGALFLFVALPGCGVVGVGLQYVPTGSGRRVTTGSPKVALQIQDSRPKDVFFRTALGDNDDAGKTGVLRLEKSPATVLREGFTQALQMAGCQILPNSPVLFEVQIQRFMAIDRENNTDTLKSDIVLDVSVRQEGSVLAKKTVYEKSTVKSSVFEPWQHSVPPLLNSSLSRAIEKAIWDADILLAIERANGLDSTRQDVLNRLYTVATTDAEKAGRSDSLRSRRLELADSAEQRETHSSTAMRHPDYTQMSATEKIAYLKSTGNWKQLSQLGEPGATAMVQLMQESDSISESREIAKALRDMDWQPQTRDEEILYLKSLGDWEELRRFGEPGIKAMFELMKESRSESVTRDIAESLDEAGWKPATSLEEVEYLMAKQNWLKLAQMGEPAKQRLISALHDERYGPRRAYIARALGKAKGPEVTEALIGTLADDSSHLRRAAAEALGEIRDPICVDALISVLKNDKDHQARVAAARALGAVRGPRAYQALMDTLKRAKGGSGAAAEALGNFGDKKAIPALVKALENRSTRRQAAKALDILGWKPVTQKEKILYCVAKKDSRCLILIATPAVAYLVEDIDNNVEVAFSAEVLGNIGDPRAVAPLVRKLQVPGVSPEVAEALKKLGWKPTTLEDEIRLLACGRNKQELLNRWDDTEQVLLKDIEDDGYPYALSLIIGIGGDDERFARVEDKLIKILNGQSALSTHMAQKMLNCDNTRLKNAARSWVKKHGHTVITLPSFNRSSGW